MPLIPAACSAAEPEPAQQTSDKGSIPDIALSPAFPNLSFIRPVFITSAGPARGDEPEMLYVLEQPGRIMAFPNDAAVSTAEVFLDLRDEVFDQHNEEGLLSLAFHPKFSDNGRFYIFYSATSPRRGVLARLRVDKENPRRADPASLEVLLEVPQPWGNHNGAAVLFGPDGYLYVSIGDGGAANDPLDAGQDLTNILATIIRIDVDRKDEGLAYAIPSDNPFVGREGAKPEIWAYGLRNVWRMSFDRETGDLWAADVGQNLWEEVNVVTRGGNYGWRIREGSHPFREGTPPDPMIDPVAEYGRREGISITGGYVYRGQAYPSLRGVYLYGDYGSRRFWGLRYADGKASEVRVLLEGRAGQHVSSFGEDAAGEIYVCAFDVADRRGGRGRIFRVVAVE